VNELIIFSQKALLHARCVEIMLECDIPKKYIIEVDKVTAHKRKMDSQPHGDKQRKITADGTDDEQEPAVSRVLHG
jgi:hypothetical protein